MFKCSECGTEYDIKPDFCDCGNDTFTEVQGSARPKEPIARPQKIIEPQQKSSSKMTFEEQYPELERLKQVFDPISTAIFMMCVIVGLLIIFVVGNPDKNTEKPKKQETVQSVAEIPSIDSRWDNSTAGVVNNEKTLAAQKAAQKNTTQTQSENLISKVQQKVEQPQNPMQAKVQNAINSPTPLQLGVPVQQQSSVTTSSVPAKNTTQAKPQQTAQTQQKTQSQQQKTTSKNTANTNTAAQTTVKPNIPKATQTAATQPKTTTAKPKDPTANWNPFGSNTSSNTPKTNTNTGTANNTSSGGNTSVSSSNTNKTTTQTQTTKTTQVPVQTTLRPKATIDTQALQKELANYKVGLRNTIGRKIDFANVVGDGECVVSFTVAANGKLTNRNFSKQSSNLTLNDAVYKAVLATPSYNPPPSGYKNETMNLKIRFYSGNFDISLN